MDRSVHLFLLNALAVAGVACASAASAESADGVGVTADNPQVVDPRVERRDINVAGIDTENFEAGAYIGTISIAVGARRTGWNAMKPWIQCVQTPWIPGSMA